MFRPMRRFKQQISEEECIEVLTQEPRGVLSFVGDNGYPCGMPMDHWYNKEDGKLYFHGTKEGYKIDSLKNCDKVSYCVYDQGYREEGDWPLHIRSVIVFGRMHFVEDPAEMEEICRTLCTKFSDDPSYPEKEWSRGKDRVLCLELDVEHMTGKMVKES